jgi:hypothetical protein
MIFLMKGKTKARKFREQKPKMLTSLTFDDIIEVVSIPKEVTLVT